MEICPVTWVDKATGPFSPSKLFARKWRRLSTAGRHGDELSLISEAEPQKSNQIIQLLTPLCSGFLRGGR